MLHRKVIFFHYGGYCFCGVLLVFLAFLVGHLHPSDGQPVALYGSGLSFDCWFCGIITVCDLRSLLQ